MRCPSHARWLAAGTRLHETTPARGLPFIPLPTNIVVLPELMMAVQPTLHFGTPPPGDRRAAVQVPEIHHVPQGLAGSQRGGF